ncbi:MAG TPA: N-acetylmuramoyl-L-alanine amidase [Anaerolineales bacterium]|nr:N-acetylmuramoyl-L-alanine amidase [Anaerolineales bacterium]
MNPPSEPGRTNFFDQILTILLAGAVVATLFTSLTPASILATGLAEVFTTGGQEAFVPAQPNEFPTPTPRPRPVIGIVAGHWGNDPGAVCADELTEVEINLTVATIVRDRLVAEGFDVDLLKEFDVRLAGYRSLALVSIHADSCDYVNDQATGFKVASAIGSADQSRSDRLSACLRNRYADLTGLTYHGNSITVDMTSYHAFDEIHHETPAVIIEIGFMNLDRQLLTRHPDQIAQGITDGILCFIRNEDINSSASADGE